MARQVVVWEYEALFEKAGLKPVLVTAPSLALVNLVRRDGRTNGVLLNLEDDDADAPGPGRSRLVPLPTEGHRRFRAGPPPTSAATTSSGRPRTRSASSRTGTRRRIERLWLRCAAAAELPEIMGRLKERIALPIEPVDYQAPEVWTDAHKAILAPLIGQIL